MKGNLVMGNNKNKYDDEFKANAVSLVTGGRTVAEIAKDLGVSEPALRRWVNETKASVYAGFSYVKEALNSFKTVRIAYSCGSNCFKVRVSL
jgi:transposase-like protein